MPLGKVLIIFYCCFQSNLPFFFLFWGTLEAAGWQALFVFILHLVSLLLPPSPSDSVKCSSWAAAFTLIIYRNNF